MSGDLTLILGGAIVIVLIFLLIVVVPMVYTILAGMSEDDPDHELCNNFDCVKDRDAEW